MNKRCKKISPDDVVHTVHYKNIKMVEKCCALNMLHVIRRSPKSISCESSKDTAMMDSICEILNFCDVCLIFHNFVEYNNNCSFAINKCNEFNIPYYIFSEHGEKFVCPFNKDKLSFRKTLMIIPERTKCDVKYDDDDKIEKQQQRISTIEQAKNRLQESYDKVSVEREQHSINLLYDKDLLKTEKSVKKVHKEMQKLKFNNNRLTYYKK